MSKNILYYFELQDGAQFEIKLSIEDLKSDKLIPIVVRAGVRNYTTWAKELGTRQVRTLKSINSVDISTGKRETIKTYDNFRIDMNLKSPRQ